MLDKNKVVYQLIVEDILEVAQECGFSKEFVEENLRDIIDRLSDAIDWIHSVRLALESLTWKEEDF